MRIKCTAEGVKSYKDHKVLASGIPTVLSSFSYAGVFTLLLPLSLASAGTAFIL